MCVSAINVTHFRPLMGLLNRDGHRLHNDPKRSARGTGAKKKKYRLEWRQGDRQEPERGQTFGVTGTEGGIKQKSESNRPRDHVAEGAHPGALPELSQSRLISETSCPLSPQFTSAPPPVQPKLLCSPFAVLPGSGS